MRRWGSRAALATALALAGIAVVGSSAAEAAKPKCFGKKATAVLGDGGVLYIGTPGNDVVVGGKGTDDISGGDGNDRICGGKGADGINGEGDKDKIAGGRGGDSLFANDGVTGELVDGGKGDDMCNFDPGDNYRACEAVPCMRLAGPPERVCRGGALGVG